MKPYFSRQLAPVLAVLVLASFSQAQTVPPAWNATTSYKVGDLVTYGADTFRCEQNQTTSHPNPHQLGWELDFVHSSVFTIPVGPTETFKTLASAWAYIASAKISNSSVLNIQLQTNYKETFTSNFSLDHAYGSKISIVGTNKGQVATFSKQGAGFVLDKGCALADFEGLSIVGPASGSSTSPAIFVNQNACLAQFKNVSIQYFAYGLQANGGGTIDNVALVTLADFTGGAWATLNGTINFVSPVTFDGGSSGATFAFKADAGTISCHKCVGIGCKNAAFSSVNGGKLDATGASASQPSIPGMVRNGIYINYGFYASTKGILLASGATNNGYSFGFYSEQGGYLDAENTTSSGSAVDYTASYGGIVDAANHNGGTMNEDTSTGAYVLGF